MKRITLGFAVCGKIVVSPSIVANSNEIEKKEDGTKLQQPINSSKMYLPSEEKILRADNKL
jgi:hypothetical protein